MIIKKQSVLALAATVIFTLAIATPASDLGFSSAGSAWAQSKNGDAPPERKTRRVPSVSQQTGQKLAKIQEAIETKLYPEASKLLDDLQKRRGLNSYEVAMVHYYRAWMKFEMDDMEGAIQSYDMVLQQENIPVSFEDNIRFSLAQLYFATEKYRKSIELLDRWIKFQETPSASAYVIKGQAHFSLEEYKEALAPIQTAIQIHKDAGLEVKENWYQLLKIIYYELGDIQKRVDILEILVLNYPPRSNTWLELAQGYGELTEEAKQLATLEVAYGQGYLEKESHIKMLAQLYLFNEAPIKAVWVLKTALDDEMIEATEKNYDLYSQALIYSKEFEDAIPPLGEACNLSEEGELCVRLGVVYLERDDFDKAIDSLILGLKKGDLKRPGQAQITLCTAYFFADRLQDSLNACREARKLPESREAANTWIKYLTNEMSRLKQLAARN